MEGPKAPRDPEKMRPYFIFKGQRNFGSNRKMEPESSSCMRVTED